MRKVLTALFIALMALASLMAAFAENDASVSINGEKMKFEKEPFITEGTTFVPMRAVFEKLGAEVQWNGDSQTITSRKDSITITMTIGSLTAYKNGEVYELQAPPVLEDDYTMIPLRFVAESLGCDVDWNGETKNITIKSKAIEGKRLGYVGDSICAGANYDGGYARVISDTLPVKLSDNKGIGGATIARNIKLNDESDIIRACIIDMIDALPAELDYVLMEGGVNDFWTNVPIGEFDTFDDATFTGAIECLMRNAKNKYPEAKLGFIINHNAFTYNAEDRYAAYYDVLKAACNKYGIPYLDLYAQNNTETGVNVKDEAQKDLYFASEGRPGGDGIHPNKLGYEKIYAEPIIQWLETL